MIHVWHGSSRIELYSVTKLIFLLSVVKNLMYQTGFTAHFET
jgi:hypothetical protein